MSDFLTPSVIPTLAELLTVSRRRDTVTFGISRELIFRQDAAEPQRFIGLRPDGELSGNPAMRSGCNGTRAISSSGPFAGSNSCTVVHGSPRVIRESSCVKSTGPCTIVDPIKVGSVRYTTAHWRDDDLRSPLSRRHQPPGRPRAGTRR